MKYIVFIIVFLNTFSNIFAWRFDHDCTDISIVDIKFIQNNQVEVTVHGPQRVSHPGYYPCCLQQGPMIIGNYKIYTNNPNDPIATIWVDRQWEMLIIEYCPCDKLRLICDGQNIWTPYTGSDDEHIT
ncbi:hypothetical protein RhiirC2_809595 [Rhizophagus irregularis]|uniref:Uncharacterized protein n=1 Tax=Rhizophagus irregularis TaxID=588596 RepID=A0A2N1MTU7_9GLOM|nr:hypothetical protein RhiirC2_809595 [Rhizophagus irregularis]